MPSLLKHVPGSFWRTLQVILYSVKWQSSPIYVQDMVVVSKFVQQHLSDCIDVLKLLQDAGVAFKLKKYFFAKINNYLDHAICLIRLEIGHFTIKAIEQLYYWATETEVRQLQALCNIFCCIFFNVLQTDKPLNQKHCMYYLNLSVLNRQWKTNSEENEGSAD